MWVLIPKLSPSAQASQDWTSPPKWSLDLAESVTWRGKQRASSSWLRAWKKGGWIRRLFTRMPEPSMVDRGVAEWISSLPVTRASHSVSPVKDSQKQTQGTSGPTSSESSVRYSQPSSFSKMSKDTSSEASAPSSVTLTNWGSMRSGECTQLPKPDTHTVATGSSSWPTPGANDYKGSSRVGQRRGQLDEAAEQKFQAPQTQPAWTPCPHCENYLCNLHEMHAHDCPCPSIEEWETDPYEVRRQAPRVTGQKSPSSTGRRLNPWFVEWLMSFPAGWTVCEHSETLSAQRRQLWLCGTSAGGSADQSTDDDSL